jgi:hypothetical protein
MPKLYHENGGWTVPGTQGRWAQRVDVPNTPFDLAMWLNARAVPPDKIGDVPVQRATDVTGPVGEGVIEELRESGYLAPQRPKVPGRCDACGRSAAGTLKLSCGHDLDELGAWLEDVQLDQLWMLQRAAELIRDRVRALGGTLEGGSVQ